MAKSKHHNYIDTIDQVLTDAVKKGIFHLYTEDAVLNGRNISVQSKDIINFGSCSYLGLELNEHIKQGAIEATKRYGTQLSSSRAYMSLGLYKELETLFNQIFKAEVVIAPSTSLAHISAIPVLVGDEDAIIIDQQVHASVQNAIQLTKARGITNTIIRHNRLDRLEEQINIYRQKHFKKIWYMIDGVYSMYGDFAPIKELRALLDKYEEFHIYVDDAHGMSWAGNNGCGYILDTVELHPKMVVATSLAKAFGVGGGVLVFPDAELARKVRTCGSSLIFSGPIQPPMLGAAIASAELHLSSGFSALQNELKERIAFTNKTIRKYNLPLISESASPIFFIGVGLPRVGYNVVKRLMNDGFYVNIGIFPGVPVKCTGIRFTNTLHQSYEDIENLVQAIHYHLPLALKDEGKTRNDIHKAFKLPLIEEKSELSVFPGDMSGLVIQYETSIQNIDKAEWNGLFQKVGTIDWDGMSFLENTFSENTLTEENFEFHYFIIRDRKSGKPCLATFFTLGVLKDDMLSHTSASIQIEQKRRDNPYYLTSLTLSMGTILSEGSHLFVDKTQHNWKHAMRLLIDKVTALEEQSGASNVILRDFDAADDEICNFLLDEGFIKVNMPNANIIEDMQWHTMEEFLQTISARNRRHVRNEAIKYEDMFDVKIKGSVSPNEMEHYYQLYQHVKDRNLGINVFELPEKIMKNMSEHPNWEFLELSLKPEFDDREHKFPVAMVCCYKAIDHYSPMIVGVDYDYNISYKVYKQALFQVVKRARQLDLNKVYLGFSADIEKHKYGAKQHPKVAYVQAKDNFNMEVIESLAAIKHHNSE